MNINNNIYLFLGVAVGLIAALASMLGDLQGELPDYAVARVNDHFISRAVYERALSAVEADKRESISQEDRERVLNRLIDEELLIQYGLRQGLVHSDRQVKSTLVQSVIQAKSMEAEAREIPDAEARKFFEAHQILFSRTDRVRVGMIRIPMTDDRGLDEAKARALEARDMLLAGTDFHQVSQTYHEGGALNLPNTLLPAAKLVDYLGPTLANMALEMEAGMTAEPVQIGQAWQLLYLHERTVAPVADFETVKEQVLGEMRRRASEDVLRSALDDLRASESVQIGGEL